MSIEHEACDLMIREVWPACNIEVINTISEREKQRAFGDYVIKEGACVLTVDVKGETNATGNFPIELIQDVESMDLGWFYTLRCDEIWYYTKAQGYVWRIDFAKLHKKIGRGKDRWRSTSATGKYGWTVILLAPFDDLMDLGISKKWWPA